VNHVVVDVEINVALVRAEAVERAFLDSGVLDNLVLFVLGAHEVVVHGDQIFSVLLGQLRQFRKRDGGIELKIVSDGRDRCLSADLLLEQFQLSSERLVLEEGLRVFEIWDGRGNELWARDREDVFEGALLTALEALQFVLELILDVGKERVLNAHRAHGMANHQQRKHLIHLLDHVVILVRGGVELTRAGQEAQHLGEGADGVGVSAHHHVTEAHVVVHGDVTGGCGEIQRLVVAGCGAEVQILDRFHGQPVVTEEGVHAEQSDDGEITQISGEIILEGISDGAVILAHVSGGAEVVADVGFVGELVQIPEDLAGVPHVVVGLDLVEIRITGLNALGDVVRVGLELVNELIQHVPQPLHRQLKTTIIVLINANKFDLEEVIQQGAIVQPGVETVVEGGLHLAVDVAMVQFLVQRDDNFIVENALDVFERRPALFLVELLGQLVEGVFVQVVDFRIVALEDEVLEILQELNHFRGGVVFTMHIVLHLHLLLLHLLLLSIILVVVLLPCCLLTLTIGGTVLVKIHRRDGHGVHVTILLVTLHLYISILYTSKRGVRVEYNM